jgi:hypothetical protein
MVEEIWKDIPGYEGMYQVSNLGNVKSLSRKLIKGKNIFFSKEIILKLTISIWGYLRISLSKELITKKFTVHQLVAMAFLNHKPCGHKLVVDHINDDKLDNRLENLQIITNRENCFKTQGKGTSNYKGVSWDKRAKRWQARIYFNGKNKNLGTFKTELEASNIYQNKLKEIQNGRHIKTN